MKTGRPQIMYIYWCYSHSTWTCTRTPRHALNTHACSQRKATHVRIPARLQLATYAHSRTFRMLLSRQYPTMEKIGEAVRQIINMFSLLGRWAATSLKQNCTSRKKRRVCIMSELEKTAYLLHGLQPGVRTVNALHSPASFCSTEDRIPAMQRALGSHLSSLRHQKLHK